MFLVMGESETKMMEDNGVGNERVRVDEKNKDQRPTVTIIEKKVGKYECPEFILSPKEEERIRKPWKYGVIVNLLGRKIGYKALESRLQQMWVQKGVINIVDIGNEYFLVTFSSMDDHKYVITQGP